MIQFQPGLGALLLGPLYIVEHSDYIYGFHKAVLDVFVCSSIMSDCVVLVREFPRRWKILSVRSDQLGVWDIQNQNFCFVLADLLANLLSKSTETGCFLLLMVMGVRYSSA